jgi:uncharacterized DUF497 family protein
MIFNWDDRKNERLKKERGISFEEIILAIDSGRLLRVLAHPNPEKYSGQKIFLVALEDHVVVVPFREEGNEIWLMTAYQSRKYTKLYLGGKETAS